MAIRLAAHVACERIADETVLLQVQSGQYYELNASGTRMLQLALEHRDLETALQHLHREFEVPGETLRKDLDTLLNELETCQLIVRDQRLTT